MYAIGGNPQAAEVAGVPVKKTLIIIYAKAAAMYGLAGFMLGASPAVHPSTWDLDTRWKRSQPAQSVVYLYRVDEERYPLQSSV